MSRHQAYEKYKDSGVEWLGEIPEHWNSTRIKFSTYVKGRVGWHGLNSKEFLYEGNFYLVTGTDFKGRTINWDTCYRITEERYEEDPYIHLKNGDILITKDGTIGKIVQVKNIPYKASVNSGVFVTRPLKNKPYKDDYMFYILNSKVFHEFIELQKSGTTIAHLYQNVFENFSYPFPPLKEQEAIANFLDRKTKQIDDLIAKKEALLAKLDEKRSAIISHAVTKGLDPTVPMKDSGIEWLGDIPKHWIRGKLNYFCKLISGGTPDRGNPIFWEGNIPWIKTGEINYQHIYSAEEYITEEGLHSSSTTLVKPETLLMAMYGQGNTRGRVAILKIEAAFNQACLAILPFENLSVYFLYYYLVSAYKYIRDIGNESSQMNLSAGVIGKIDIVIPDLELQKNIVDYLDKKTVEIDLQKTKVQEAIERLKEYRTALITNAVTGKIDVRQVPLN